MKIEAFNRFCRAAFISEIKASSIQTLDALNAAFGAWVERFYNRRPHGETNEPPRDRWRVGLQRVQHVDEEVLRRAFLWSETRKADKTGVLSLFGRRYQVGPDLARKKVELRYDPEHLDELEVWFDDRFRERIRAFEVQPHRRPKAEVADDKVEGNADPTPVADWLGHLVAERGAVLNDDPERQLRQELERRRLLDEAFIDALRDRLDEAVFDEPTARQWLRHYGPLDTEPVVELLDFTIEHMGTGQHVQQYLDAVHAALLEGGEQ